MPAKLSLTMATLGDMVEVTPLAGTMSPSVATVSDNLAGMTLSKFEVMHKPQASCCTDHQICPDLQ